jgi:hypothetical protein
MSRTGEQLPKEVTRPPPPTSSWMLQVKKRTPRAQGAIEIRKHFLPFRDGRFKGLRAQCVFCRKEMGDDLQIIQRHLATCQQLLPHVHRPSPRDRRCTLCFQLIKIDRLDVHIERCEGRKRCRWCLGAFKDAAISMHTEECKKKFRVCRNCKKSGIPIEALEAHLEACPFKRCHRCDTTVLTLDWEKHSKAC